ncbi:HlyC/CorC family transporter [Candidatus Uhrbacteria bacterium]|nr:HlyC/CorC family transporter [Candidatus Uhrbacteria bacterium]
MNEIVLEISIVLALILLNAFFSGTEMAFISLRKTRVKQLAKEGVRPAMLAEKMLQKPEHFLATIQIGITLIGTIASAYAGASIADAISPILSHSPIPFLSTYAEIISLGSIILIITYLSIVIGELIPKSLGIKFSESIALAVVYPLYFLSKITRPVTNLLTFSSNLLLTPIGDKTSFSEANLTEEELRTILYESHRAGTIKKHEHELLDNVFDFSDIAVSQIMTPRSKIFAIDINEPYEQNVKKVAESGYARVPVFRDKIDTIIGTLSIKALLRSLSADSSTPLSSFENLLYGPYFVPNTRRISDLLKHMQKEKINMAIVTDEHGDVDGIVTIEDILEEIVGDIKDEDRPEKNLITQENNENFVVDGSLSIVDFNRYFKSHLSEDASYTTISGLLLDTFEQIAEVGTTATIQNFEFTIKEKTERVITMVGVKLLRS